MNQEVLQTDKKKSESQGLINAQILIYLINPQIVI